jgi:hypothetical protein
LLYKSGLIHMGSFAESSAKTSQTSRNTTDGNVITNTDPWGAQSGYLKDTFGQAQDIYDAQKGVNYTGDHLAAFRPEQLDMFKGMINYANTSPIASMLANQGSTLGKVGTGGVQGALKGYQDFRPAGSTMGTIADAGLYADNPYISSMVDAATRDAGRGLYEGALPQSARTSAISGNTNSSKSAIRDGILERGYQDLRGDVSADLRGQAYKQGLDLAQQQRQHEDQVGLERLSGFGSLGLGAANQGMTGLNDSVKAMSDLFQLGNQGGEGLQASDQQKLSNELAKYQFNQQDPWGSLMNYYNIVGGDKWGGTANVSTDMTEYGNQNGTVTQQPSMANIFGGILGGIGSLGGLGGLWGSK